MANARGPWYVRLNYVSAYAPHSATIQTREWTPTASVGGHGQFLNWNDLGTDADAMVNGLANTMCLFLPTTVTFQTWQVFNQPEDPGPSFPRDGNVFTGVIGIDATSSWSKAVEFTINTRTTGFGAQKIVLLDMASRNDFNPAVTPSTDMNTLLTELFDMGNGWAGRDNLRPAVFVSATKTLNEKLRKSYRMA